MNKRLPLFSITLLASMFLLSACSDDPSSVNDEPPELPSAASMEIDLSTLLGDTSAQKQQPIAAQAINNYIQAVYKVGSLEGVIEDNLSRPGQLLEAAQGTMAELNDDQMWEWGYDHGIGASQYAVRLVAEQIAAATVNWSFYVTTDSLDIENHLYITGTTTEEGREGVWTINGLSSSGGGDPVAEIDWGLRADSTHVTLDILAGGSGSAGSYVDYSTEDTVETVEYHDSSSGETYTIQWDADSRAGSITAADINNGERACWDENLQDIPCDL